jgi:hypothetical protein
MPKSVIPYLLLIGVSSSPLASAETFIIDSGLASAYHFVDTYEILIDGPAETV